MKFFMPTKAYIENNCVWNHKKELASYGTKAFIVTGKHSANLNGSLKDVTECLESEGISYVLFQDIEENPSVETCARAAGIGIESGADFVIGIGGGSPMDASKAIALLMANPDESSDCFYVKKDLTALPVIAVPTTCGTGSEVTGKAVLTRHALKTKKSISYDIYPELALIDGRYLKAANASILLNTSIDALAQLVESRLNSASNIFNQMFADYGLKLWSGLLPYLKGEKTIDEGGYELFMLVSTVAGMSIAQAGTSIPHAMSYDLTYNYGTPHGKACGYYLPSYMELYASQCPDEVSYALSLLGFDSIEDFKTMIEGFFGKPVIKKAEFPVFVDNLMQNPAKLVTVPFEVTRADIEKMLADSVLLGE